MGVADFPEIEFSCKALIAPSVNTEKPDLHLEYAYEHCEQDRPEKRHYSRR
jgi:hypothetical protein